MTEPTELNIRAGAIRLASIVATKKPFFIGRNGTIEVETLFFWSIARRTTNSSREYPPRIVDQIQRNAGVFPATDSSIDAWCEAYTSALCQVDAMAAGWYKPVAAAEGSLLSEFAHHTLVRTPLRSLEPYYVAPEHRWTRWLSGKKVCVVSSFAETASRQVWGGHMDAVWKGVAGTDISGVGCGIFPPDIDWSFIRTGYAPTTAMGYAGWPADVHTWQDAVRYVVSQVKSYQPDVALIGCGALGMLIAAELHAAGISAFVLGGAVQVLFGIKGQRWATHDVISNFWNDAWRWPAADEVPGGARYVEGGCYWGGRTGSSNGQARTQWS